MIPFIADRPKIRNKLPTIIQYLKKKLNITEEDEEDIPDEDIVDMVFNYGGEPALNDLVVDFKPVYKPEVIKKAGNKIID